MTFGERLREAMDNRGQFCVGIDPHPGLLQQWGMTDSAVGLERFALTAAEVLAQHVPVVKPQSAFFERHGAAGIAVLEKVVAACRERGALVLLDVKRGDIGSTAQAYADAYLDPTSPLAVDAVTASPYLGFGSLQPLVDVAQLHGAGVFVLALTSNPEGGQVQRARVEDGRTVAQVVLDEVGRCNAGAEPFGSVGAVVGATMDGSGHDFAVNGPLLVPGVGAQGGTADDVRRLFGEQARNVLPSSSRGVLAAGPDKARLRSALEEAAAPFADLAAS